MTTITNTAPDTTATPTATATKKTTRVRFSPEWWSFWAGVWAVALTAAAAMAGLIAWYFSEKASDAKDAAQEKFQIESKAAIAAADSRAATANEKAALANERTANLELDAAKQRERAANAEKELLALREKIKPRELGASGMAVLTESLRSASPKGEVVVVFLNGDAEAGSFANEIHRSFVNAGWAVNPMLGTVNTLSGYGVLVRVRDADAPGSEHARLIAQVLRAVGIMLFIENDAKELPPGRVMLWIGTKDPNIPNPATKTKRNPHLVY